MEIMVIQIVPKNIRSLQRKTIRVFLAGRDLVGGGTWLGIELPDDEEEEDNTNDSNTENTSLRWIAITNFWERDEHGRPSHGGLLMTI